MVKIRLTRTGRKNYANYKIVVTPHTKARDSKVIEHVGFYNPHSKQLEVNGERVQYWLSVGAQPSETVKRLLVKKDVIKAEKSERKFNKKPGKKKQARAPKAQE